MGASFGPRDTAWGRGLSIRPPVNQTQRVARCNVLARPGRAQTTSALLDPIEGRWAKNGVWRIVLNEPLAFYAARTRPRPGGGSPTTRLTIITRPPPRSFTLSPTRNSMPDFLSVHDRCD